MRRTLLGITAAVVLLAGSIVLVAVGEANSDWSLLASVLLRCGAILALIWLAIPEFRDLRKRYSPLTLITASVGCLLALVTRSVFVLIAFATIVTGLQFVAWLKKKPTSRTKPAKTGTAQRNPRAHLAPRESSSGERAG